MFPSPAYLTAVDIRYQKRRGPFQSLPVLRAFLTYFTSHGIQVRLPSEDTGRPAGALAMAAAAVRPLAFRL